MSTECLQTLPEWQLSTVKTPIIERSAENVSKHQVHILSATKRRESVQVIRDVSEHCQTVI